MKIVVGLGNFGDKYAYTFHNMGYLSIELLADRLGLKFDKKECDSLVAVGYKGGDYYVDAAEQAGYHERQRAYALGACAENKVARIPSGDAWKIVRDGGYDNLCARIAFGDGLGDNFHDGDIGGGQYLNACVWFETLTGQSCIGNTFRPDYELSEELIAALQNAAHQAVAALE